MSTTLDDLDRLAFLLARRVRAHHPAWLTQGFTLADLELRLVPHPEARDELADSSPEHHARLVLRLLVGERGYLLTDKTLRERAREALTHTSPSLSLVRPLATTRVVLARPSAGLRDDRAPARPEPASSRAALGSWVSAPAWEAPGARPQPPAPATDAGVKGPAPGEAPCLHCGGLLPATRALAFCPHCGCDLRRRQCPACSTELEVAWRFCVTCGRSAEGVDPASPPAPEEGVGAGAPAAPSP